MAASARFCSLDGIVSSPDVVTPVKSLNKGNIFKKKAGIAHLLGFIINAYKPKVGLKSPKEVVHLPNVPCPIAGWRSKCIFFWGGGHLDQSTITHIGHCGHVDLKLSF